MSKWKAEAVSFPNIALIKYWGKHDIKNNIPTNSSISLSLPKLITKTTITESGSDKDKDIFYLDGEVFPINERMERVIGIFKATQNASASIRIESHNAFPHSCGLASSASGISALVKALNIFYSTGLNARELSEIARIGSGSACRSIENGLIEWINTYAVKVGDWEDLKVFVIVLDGVKKNVGSTEGMIRTASTSSLFQHRLGRIDEKIQDVELFVKEKRFGDLGLLVMRESNELHAVCMDSLPPILYLNSESIRMTNEIMKLNEREFVAFYSFDAGPNPFVFVLEKNYQFVYNHFRIKLGCKTIEAR